MEEDTVAVFDRVGFRVLEIGIRVDTEEIAGVDDVDIGSIHPRRPGIDMADRDTTGSSTGNSGTHLTNVTDEIGWIGADSGQIDDADGRVAVQVFAADRDSRD